VTLDVKTDPITKKQQLKNPDEGVAKDSILNTILATQELILPMDTAWEGMVIWSGKLKNTENKHSHVLVDIQTEGRNVIDTLIPGSNYALTDSVQVANRGGQAVEVLSRIPNYIATPLQSPSRSWHRLRFVVKLTVNDAPMDITNQRLTATVRPVT